MEFQNIQKKMSLCYPILAVSVTYIYIYISEELYHTSPLPIPSYDNQNSNIIIRSSFYSLMVKIREQKRTSDLNIMKTRKDDEIFKINKQLSLLTALQS